ncbi:phosphopantetheine-binding protein, partial [Streptomyces sp. TR06-5]|uniref:phosphopantetheine-binding protein n=1 Tax=unclassified Streptomyces TaxID=2593676 RepID=UPI0039A124FA
EGADPVAADLRNYATEQLPAYMVPSSWVFLDSLPLTPNGKLDRAALPVPDFRGTAAGGRAAGTPLEKQLCGLFADILGWGEVGADTSFLELGGHSLLAARLVSRVRSELGVEVSVGDVFRAPTAAELARVVADAPRARPVLTAGTRPQDGRLAPAQQRIWFLDQAAGPSALYNVAFTVRLRGTVDQQALRDALGDVVARHEALRTVFPAPDGEPRQQVLQPGTAPALL